MLLQLGMEVPLGCAHGEPAVGFFMILGTHGAGTVGVFTILGVGTIGAMEVGITGVGGTTIGTTGVGIVGDQQSLGVLFTPMATAAIDIQRRFAVETI
jgi:hypothetical protein